MGCRLSTRVSVRSFAVACSLMFATLTLACSPHDKPAVTDTTSSVAAGSLADSAAPASVQGTVHLEVIGGLLPGSYDATMKDGGCSYGLAGATAWGNQYSVDAKDPKTFSSLQLIVPDTKAAAAGTQVFELTAGFGPLFGNGATRYDVNTLPTAGAKSGSGTVSVDDKGKTGKVTFDVKTAEGVALKGTIVCNSVMRAS